MGVKAKRIRMANSGYPLLLFLVGLGLSALAGYWQHVSIDVLAKEEFGRMSVRTEFEIVCNAASYRPFWLPSSGITHQTLPFANW